jgi:hypothetical protein
VEEREDGGKNKEEGKGRRKRSKMELRKRINI